MGRGTSALTLNVKVSELYTVFLGGEEPVVSHLNMGLSGSRMWSGRFGVCVLKIEPRIPQL